MSAGATECGAERRDPGRPVEHRHPGGGQPGLGSTGRSSEILKNPVSMECLHSSRSAGTSSMMKQSLLRFWTISQPSGKKNSGAWRRETGHQGGGRTGYPTAVDRRATDYRCGDPENRHYGLCRHDQQAYRRAATVAPVSCRRAFPGPMGTVSWLINGYSQTSTMVL